MQTPILPLPTFGANAAAAPKVSFNASGQDNQFQQALSRELRFRTRRPEIIACEIRLHMLATGNVKKLIRAYMSNDHMTALL